MAVGFTGGHAETYRVHLLNSQEIDLFELHMADGSIDGNAFRVIQWGGQITIKTPDVPVNWLTARVGITYIAEKKSARIERRIMVGMVTAKADSSQRGFLDLTLMDKISILVEDSLAESLSLSGTAIGTEEVDALIRSTGEFKVAITPSALTLRVPMNWPAGTPTITVINDILAAIGYQPLWVDGSGTFCSSRLLDVTEREVVHSFLSGPQAVHEPEVKDELDLFNIPNRVVCISTSDGETEALVSVAENHDPLSDYSIENRNRVITRKEEGVDAASQEVLDAIAANLLRSSSQVTWRQSLTHLPLDLTLDAAVISPSGKLASVVELKQTLKAGELMNTVTRRFDNVA